MSAIAILCKVRPEEDAVAALQAAVTITITRVITNTQSQLSTPASSQHNLQNTITLKSIGFCVLASQGHLSI